MPESNTKYNTITNLRNNLTPKNPTNGKNYIISLCDVSDQLQKIYLANKSKLYEHNISLLVVAVNVEYSQKEVEKEFYTEISRLKLTLIP